MRHFLGSMAGRWLSVVKVKRHPTSLLLCQSVLVHVRWSSAGRREAASMETPAQEQHQIRQGPGEHLLWAGRSRGHGTASRVAGGTGGVVGGAWCRLLYEGVLGEMGRLKLDGGEARGQVEADHIGDTRLAV